MPPATSHPTNPSPLGLPADDLDAELATAYRAAYRERMATIGFLAMARQFPGLVAQAVRLGWQASRRDTIATIAASLAAGVFTGYALLASTSVLQALFAVGPTPALGPGRDPGAGAGGRGRRGPVRPAGSRGLVPPGPAGAVDRLGRGDPAVRAHHPAGLQSNALSSEMDRLARPFLPGGRTEAVGADGIHRKSAVAAPAWSRLVPARRNQALSVGVRPIPVVGPPCGVSMTIQ